MSSTIHMGSNGGTSLLEAEIFLASLQSDESDNDNYDLFNGATNEQGLNDEKLQNGSNLPLNHLTPESYRSQVPFSIGQMQGLNSDSRKNEYSNINYMDFTSPIDSSDADVGFANVKIEHDFNINGGLSSNNPVVEQVLLMEGSKEISANDPTSVMPTDSNSSSSTAVPTPSAEKVGKFNKTKGKRVRMSHNIIEKKYRTNINDKIVQLRELVPALRIGSKKEAGIPVTEEDRVHLDGLEPARKLNKASILTKTIEYIRHLERKCASFQCENVKLRNCQGISTPESVGRHSTSQNNSMNMSSDSMLYSHLGGIPIENSSNSPTHMAHAYPLSQGINSNELTGNKLLLGGLALTMGATCFGDNDDFNNAKGLFAMPVFHFSPTTNGFTISNSSGMPLNLKSSLLSLTRLLLLFFLLTKFVMALLFGKSSATFGEADGKNSNSDSDTNGSEVLIHFSDNVAFGNSSALRTTLKKTLFINRLKYPFNSIERVESEIAKCFALNVYSESLLNSESRILSFFRYLVTRYVNKCWDKICVQVNAANQFAKKKGQDFGIEWEMITNILDATKEKTLDNRDIIASLRGSGNTHYSLSDFVSLINNFIVDATTISVLTSLMEETINESNKEVELESIVKRIHQVEIRNNPSLTLIHENYILLNALLNLSKGSTQKLLELINFDNENSDNVAVNKKKSQTAKSDCQLVLYSSIIRQFNLRQQFEKIPLLVGKVNLKYVSDNDCTLLGIAGLYLSLRSLMQHDSRLPNNLFPFLENLATTLRIWLGSSSGDVLELELRGKLIDYCVSVALQCGEKVQFSHEDYDDADDDNDADDDSSSETGMDVILSN